MSELRSRTSGRLLRSLLRRNDPYLGWVFGVEFRGGDVVVMARAPGSAEWRTILTVTPLPDETERVAIVRWPREVSR